MANRFRLPKFLPLAALALAASLGGCIAYPAYPAYPGYAAYPAYGGVYYGGGYGWGYGGGWRR